jgi:hypothetical protein
MPPEAIDANTQALMVQRYLDGWPVATIAEEVYWHPATVRKYLRLHGLRLERGRRAHYHGIDPEELRETVQLYRSGLSMAEVARALHISLSTVHARLRTAGEPSRKSATGVKIACLARPRTGPVRDRVLAVLDHAPEPLLASEVARRAELRTGRVVDSLAQLAHRGVVRAADFVVLHGRRRPLWERTPHSDIHRVVLGLVTEPRRPSRPGDGPGCGPELPIEPLRAWLEDRLRFYGGHGALADALGVDERTLTRYLYESRVVRFSKADAMLTYEGTATTIYDLWPQLATDDPDLLAEARYVPKPTPAARRATAGRAIKPEQGVAA